MHLVCDKHGDNVCVLTSESDECAVCAQEPAAAELAAIRYALGHHYEQRTGDTAHCVAKVCGALRLIDQGHERVTAERNALRDELKALRGSQ